MAERKITNNTILLFLGTDPDDLDVVVCGTSIKDDYTLDEVDASSFCGPDKSPGDISGTISFEAQHLLDPATGKVSGKGLWDYFTGKTTLYWKIGPAVPVSGDIVKTGQAFISALGSSYSLNTQSSFSMTLSIKGVPVETVFEEVIEEVIPMEGLWAWFDAGQGVTGTTTVTAWADQSGNGHDLISSLSLGETDYPELIASAINGQSVVSSSGLECRMATAANLPDCSAGGTIILVAAQSENGVPGSDSGGAFVASSSSNNMLLRRGNTSSSDIDGVHVSIRGGFNTSTQALSGNLVLDDEFYTMTMVYDGTENKLEVNDNGYGTPVTADGSGYFGYPLNMFKNAGSATGSKKIAFCAVYTRTLTDPEIEGIKTYLQTKYAHY